MRESTRMFLIEHSEETYKEFSGSLIPGEKTMLGVRLPILRKKAQEIAKKDWKEELKIEDAYFEEVMLRGMIISYVKGSMDEILPYIEAFIPCVNNWSVCDSVFMKMDVLRTDRERTWQFIQPYLQSEKEFEVRVAIIIMMQHLLKCDENGKTMKRLRHVSMSQCISKGGVDGSQPEGMYLERVLQALDKSYTQYYASMAAAWTIAEAFCCFPSRVYTFLQENQLDDVTYNRALQKIVESLIPEPEVKECIKSMKRKGRKNI
ncbi:MAG: DNA alkylation repair protein [Lachnospiraceae bacterium]|nr:DNA alkylation repair protein [Lachnospiraceae bacterium]